MKAFIDDLEDLTEANRDFRHVLYTGTRMQLVLMSLQPGEDIGEEIHENTDQLIRVEEGTGTLSIDGREWRIKSDVAAMIPAGTMHNVKNTGEKPLKLYTLYAPPEHINGTVHHTKADAEAAAPQEVLPDSLTVPSRRHRESSGTP
jgi:mannose-6-phosphate isomerase-like protein (cupin superfamily)